MQGLSKHTGDLLDVQLCLGIHSKPGMALLCWVDRSPVIYSTT